MAKTMDETPIISEDIGLLGESLETLILRNNFIGGILPNSIRDLALLLSFDVGYNKFEGTLPNDLFANATGLEIVRVGHNFFSGTMKELRLYHLSELNLSFNNCTGNITEILGYVPKLGESQFVTYYFDGRIVVCR